MRWLLIHLLILTGLLSQAQPDTIFNGTIGDGHATLELQTEIPFFTGSTGDGHATSTIMLPIPFFNGSIGDGHAAEDITMSIPFFNGSTGDGHAFAIVCQTYTWIGAQGTGWNVVENWDSNKVPCNCNAVIIPSSSTNFPNVNAGILKIGYHLDDGDFNALKIWVKNGASFYTRINNFVENYGLLKINGYMQVRNPVSNALINHSTGLIEIGPNGWLIFKEL